MADNFRFGDSPAPEVLSYLEGRNMVRSFSWKDWYGQEHAYAFTAAKAMQVDVLTAIKEETDRAIREGLSYESFSKNLTPRLKKLGWWGKQEMIDPLTEEVTRAQLGSPRRLKTIYWANTRSAYAAGKWQRYQRTKNALPYLIYQLGPSKEHRPHHEAKKDVIKPIDDPFWNVWFTPNGWGCKCWTRQISRREAERLGGVTEQVDIPMRTWVNDRTGETKQIPEGIDPGWENNPGIERGRNLARHLAGKLDAAPDIVRRAAVNDMAKSFLFDRVRSGYYGQAKVFAPAVVIPSHVSKAVGASTNVAFFSAQDAAKQLRKNRHLSNEQYTIAQRMLDQFPVYQEFNKDAGRWSDFTTHGWIDGQMWRAVFRVTQNGDEIFLKSLRRAKSEKQLDEYSKRGKLIVKEE